MNKPQIKSEATIVTDRKWRIELTSLMIVEALRGAGYQIPPGATVSFRVPGGGDWSHMSIDIDAENPVYVEWKSHSIESREIPE